ncbi:Crp/Fnr family transcriptional regulator [Woodsholea maritima]|uniref:Crp/Fnr family transcriptional regulator n=1 Tax=Woodsholea maritima TaxID=240237 RepID=UPI00035CE767|nr:Crp/Fnr family transcriptional regulator [Woodsholea maritima]
MNAPLSNELSQAFPDLASSPLFLNALVNASSLQKIKPGELALQQDDKNDGVFFILSGKARAIIYSRGGDEIWIDDLKAGDIFGEMAALNDQPRANYVKAQTQLKVLRLPSAVFLHYVETEGHFALWLNRLLARRVARTTTRMYELSALSATGRVFAELLREANYSPNQDNNHLVITSSPSMTDLAKRVHSTRETVSRTVNALERHGLIRREGKRMILISPDALWAGQTNPNSID